MGAPLKRTDGKNAVAIKGKAQRGRSHDEKTADGKGRLNAGRETGESPLTQLLTSAVEMAKLSKDLCTRRGCAKEER